MIKLAYEGDTEWVRLAPMPGLEWLESIEVQARAVRRAWLSDWSRRYDLVIARERSRTRGADSAAMSAEASAELDALYRELLIEGLVDARGFERRGDALEDVTSVGLLAHVVKAVLAFQAPTPRQRDCLPGTGELAPGGAGGA
jgi:hypothetical protein